MDDGNNNNNNNNNKITWKVWMVVEPIHKVLEPLMKNK
jgi:hypothetical protein